MYLRIEIIWRAFQIDLGMTEMNRKRKAVAIDGLCLMMREIILTYVALVQCSVHIMDFPLITVV